VKKDIGKWCEFHKTPTHNMNECRVKQALVAKLKYSKMDMCSDIELEPYKGIKNGKKIIEAEPTTPVATTKLQKEKPEDLEEGKHLFHSQM